MGRTHFPYKCYVDNANFEGTSLSLAAVEYCSAQEGFGVPGKTREKEEAARVRGAHGDLKPSSGCESPPATVRGTIRGTRQVRALLLRRETW